METKADAVSPFLLISVTVSCSLPACSGASWSGSHPRLHQVRLCAGSLSSVPQRHQAIRAAMSLNISPSKTRATDNRDNGVKDEASSGPSNSMKPSRTHQELHKELLLAHKRGLVLSRRSELQQVLERRKQVQSQKEEEEHCRTPLEDVLLKHHQKHLEREKQQEEKAEEDVHLMEFVRVRQNLRKIHNKATNR
ncbi:uncharacterized protein si:ch211-218o21.4 [Thalassophryne amazonica]|uniref:uncharacterized protein si:ch211-218o21.4 n=1 Tax=Thalassophryne amazonica TaxID=390379 RepID=UPI0014724959|nr:uncharacterized protein si:ch211-218o21.4 [Thalassophryne amazonica]